MARLSVAAALFVCILSPQPCLLQETADDQVTGEARDDLPRVLREMCYQSRNRYFQRLENKPSLAPSWISEILQYEISQRADQYFYERPVHSKLHFALHCVQHYCILSVVSSKKLHLCTYEHHVL